MESVPVLDISKLNVNKSLEDIDIEDWNAIKDGLIDALVQVGFLQVTGHGVPRESIDNCFDCGKRFFARPDDYKMMYYRDYKRTRCGFVPFANKNTENVVTERFDFDKPADLKEALDVCHSCDNWHDKEFEQSTKKLIHSSQQLILRLMKLLGYGLMPDDPEFFVRKHQKFATKENTSQLRFLHYPPVSDELKEIPPGLMRCGEHTDYGCLTLVFMDTCPGLQVFTRSQKYIDVLPRDDAILVNIGDLMQRWTGDSLRSAKHRVVFRDKESYCRTRYSLVYFSHPDENEVITPVVGPGLHYPTVTVKDHMERRFNDTFALGKGLDETLTMVK